MSSVHKQCGADITWAKRPDGSGRFFPPMEYVGEVFLLEGQGEDRVAEQRHCYRIHQCDPDRIEEWQDYQHRLAEATGEEYTPYAAARQKENDDLWAQVLHVECPRCLAPVGEKCHSLARQHLKTGEIVECRNPHPARTQAFEIWFRQEGDTNGSQAED